MAQRRRTGFTPSRTKALAVLVGDQDAVRHSAVDVIDAALVNGEQPELASDVIEAVLASFITESGRLVPARSAPADGTPVSDPTQRRRLERAQLIDEMRAGAMADGTLYAYGGHVRAWMTWCRDEGVPALPFDPRLVANCLLDYALVWDFDAEDYLRDENGELVQAVAMGTVDTRLKALNKAAEFVGLPRPGDNQGVKEVMAGLRRRFGTASTGKAALDLEGINRCLAAATGLTYVDARNRAMVLLRARTGATAGQMASLMWADVDVADDSSEVTIRLGKTHRHGEPITVAVHAHRSPDLCLVRMLLDLEALAPRLREVFSHQTGKPLSRQAIHNNLKGVWDALPEMSGGDLAVLLAEQYPVTVSFSTARDRALLLVAFYTALRRSNLSALNWRDITDHGDDGLAVFVRRSKTDQEGKGRTVWVPQAPSSAALACPAEALRSWRIELERVLGRSVRDSDPVFVSLTSSGALKNPDRPRRLSGNAVSEVVQRLAVASGLTEKPRPGQKNPYGAHSTRAGFVTEATRDDKLSIVEVMEVTGHTSAEMVARYRREANAPKRNASRKLVQVLSE